MRERTGLCSAHCCQQLIQLTKQLSCNIGHHHGHRRPQHLEMGTTTPHHHLQARLSSTLHCSQSRPGFMKGHLTSREGGNNQSLEGNGAETRELSLPTRRAVRSTGKVIFTQSGHYHTAILDWIIGLSLVQIVTLSRRVSEHY